MTMKKAEFIVHLGVQDWGNLSQEDVTSLQHELNEPIAHYFGVSAEDVEVELKLHGVFVNGMQPDHGFHAELRWDPHYRPCNNDTFIGVEDLASSLKKMLNGRFPAGDGEPECWVKARHLSW